MSERVSCCLCAAWFSVGKSTGFSPVAALLWKSGCPVGLEIEGRAVCSRCARGVLVEALEKREAAI